MLLPLLSGDGRGTTIGCLVGGLNSCTQKHLIMKENYRRSKIACVETYINKVSKGKVNQKYLHHKAVALKSHRTIWGGGGGANCCGYMVNVCLI